MGKPPMVSVLMTAYNRAGFIRQAIESVLSSTYQSFELLIVDDCSTDTTVSIAQEYAARDNRIKVYVNERNLGDYPNRNKAASYASGKYIKYLDSDDVMYPHCLEVMVSSMERFPEAGYGLSSISDEQRPYPVQVSCRDTYLENFYGYGHFGRAPGSAIIKLASFNQVGGFSGERMIGDADLWYKMAMYFPLVKFPSYLYWDRQHESQERQSVYARKEYPALQQMVLQRYFSHADCPLNEQEKKMILDKRKRDQIKGRIKAYLNRIKK